MLRFLSLFLMLFLAALFGFIYGRSDQSSTVAVASVKGVCQLADTTLGRRLNQEQVDRTVGNLANLLRLDDEERAGLAQQAAQSPRQTPCGEALARLEAAQPNRSTSL